MAVMVVNICKRTSDWENAPKMAKATEIFWGENVQCILVLTVRL